MIVEVINTGTELLLGSTLNTHLAFLGKELFPLGLRVARQVTVPDGEAIADAMREAVRRAEIILVTGGLGPTTDDLTREIAAELFNLPLEESEDVWQRIQERFARRNFKLTERVRRQAQVPRGAAILHNDHGTAPGLYIRHAVPDMEETAARHLFLLPGPPRELRPMFTNAVLPLLKTLLPGRAGVGMRSFLVIGVGESHVEALVGEELLALPGLELGYSARPGAVEVRCIGPAGTLERAEAMIRKHLSAHIAAEDGMALEEAVVKQLTARGKTVTTAESCTGGLIANRLTNIPGASSVFKSGFVTYDNEVKIATLGVPRALLAAHGDEVSEPVAQAMAEGALERAGADYALATTGFAGPDGGTMEHPVGTVFIALAARGSRTIVLKQSFPTDRVTFKELTAQTALDLLRRAL